MVAIYTLKVETGTQHLVFVIQKKRRIFALTGTYDKLIVLSEEPRRLRFPLTVDSVPGVVDTSVDNMLFNIITSKTQEK